MTASWNTRPMELDIFESSLLRSLAAGVNIRSLKKDIEKYMTPLYAKYPTGMSLNQAAFHELFLAKATEIPKCPVCKSELKFYGVKKGYAKNCSYSCRSKNPESSKRSRETNISKYGKEYASQSATFRDNVKATCILKYGVDNAFKTDEAKEKYRATCNEKYGVDNASKSTKVIDKIRESHVKSGRWLSKDCKSAIELYRIEVARISARSYHDWFYRINPDNLQRSRFAYHLDHIFSVEEGFRQNVPPEVIGHYTNLQMMWCVDNSRKNTHCHKSKDSLMNDYTAAILLIGETHE